MKRLLDSLKNIVGADAIITAASELMVYECDGFTIEKNRPDVVVFPTTTEQVSKIVDACNYFKVRNMSLGHCWPSSLKEGRTKHGVKCFEM